MDADQPNIAPTVIHTLHNRVITNMDKYMQDAERQHQKDDNYFDAITLYNNTLPVPQIVESTPCSPEHNKKDMMEKSQPPVQSIQGIPEPQEEDTSKAILTSEQDDNHTNADDAEESHNLSTIQEETSPAEIQHPNTTEKTTQDESEDDTDPKTTTEETIVPVSNPDSDMAETTATSSTIEEVGSPHLTLQLHKFLEQFSSFSNKQAFLQLYHMLSILDQYLYENPSQHRHCMFHFISLIRF